MENPKEHLAVARFIPSKEATILNRTKLFLVFVINMQILTFGIFSEIYIVEIHTYTDRNK